MRFFGRLFRGRDAPVNKTAGSAYSFFLGTTASGKRVNERSAMQMTAVYSCVRILAEAVAGLPLHLYKYTDGGGKEKALDHPLYRLLHDEPNPEMSSFVFRETLMTHLLLWGNAYAQVIRNGKNEVVALYPLMPNKMTVDRDENGRLYYRYNRGQDEAVKSKDQTVILMYCIIKKSTRPKQVLFYTPKSASESAASLDFSVKSRVMVSASPLFAHGKNFYKTCRVYYRKREERNQHTDKHR